jgi:hypothetical protein
VGLGCSGSFGAFGGLVLGFWGIRDDRGTAFEFSGAPDLKSYIGVLSAQQIHQLYTRHRDKLFNLNIRNYIGDTRTNKDIIRTAKEEPDRFFTTTMGSQP